MSYSSIVQNCNDHWGDNMTFRPVHLRTRNPYDDKKYIHVKIRDLAIHMYTEYLNDVIKSLMKSSRE